ncbi:MAG: hypothetical protein JSU75_03840 [Gammaproteobacteria bacterium]|nr:MAG: hypothetical protein JSU75_03840 [Gammaproteobacteria bacterium]
MNKIIYVPGKNPKPPSTWHGEQLLRCLLHGIRKQDVDIAMAIETSGAFSLVAWNYLFYNHHRDIERDIPWIDRLLEQDTLLPRDTNEAKPPRYRFAKLMYQIGDAMHWLIPLIPDQRIKSEIRETEHYFANRDNIACRIREILKLSLRKHVEAGERMLLVGHSMGSIIAYDALWELHHDEGMEDCIDCLLTIGSPLGMRYVQKRLVGSKQPHPRRYPGNIRSWVNISAHGDLVALDPSLGNDFSEMVTKKYIDRIDDRSDQIFNYYRDDRGLNVHKSYGYLVNPVVARVIADWWKAV